MHNPAARRSLMPCSHPQCCLCGKTIFWHQCVNIMVLRCSISQFAPSQSHPHPPMFLLPSYFLTVHIYDFFFPSIRSFLSTPLAFPSFLSPIPTSLSFHLPFPWSSLALGRWWWWRGLLLLHPRHWYSAFTHWHCPGAWRLLLPWLRLMEKLHRLLFWTIVFTHTYLGRCCHSEKLAAGEAETGKGVSNHSQRRRMHANLTMKHLQTHTLS